MEDLDIESSAKTEVSEVSTYEWFLTILIHFWETMKQNKRDNFIPLLLPSHHYLTEADTMHSHMPYISFLWRVYNK